MGAGCVVLAIAAGITEAAVLGSEPLTTWGYAAGLAGFFVLGPVVIALYARHGEALSLLPAVTGFFLLEFGIGGIFYHRPRLDSVLADLVYTYTSGSVGVAMILAFASWVLVVVGYQAVRALDEPIARLPRPQVNDRVTGVAILLIALGWLARVVLFSRGWYFHVTGEAAAESGLRNIVQVLSSLPLLATAMIGARCYRERPGDAGLFYALIAVETLWAVPSGGRAQLISLGLALLVVRTYASPKAFPVGRAALFAAFAMLVVFPLGASYRDIGASSNRYNSDPVGQLSTAASRMLHQYSVDPAKAITEGVDQTVQRFAGITSVAAMANRGTQAYPAEPGEAVVGYAGALVPRALLPSKADTSTLTTDFGYRYGIIRPGTITAVAMTTVGDLWGTFGLAGLFIGMVIMGGLVRALDQYLRERRDNYAVLALYGTVLGSFLLSFETSVAVGFLQTLRSLVIYVIMIGLAGGTVRVMQGYRPSTVRHRSGPSVASALGDARRQ